MRPAKHAALVLALAFFSGCQRSTPAAHVASIPRLAQETPNVTSVTNLSLYPLRFDGRLVVVRAWYVNGWEGDNFLFEATASFDRKTIPGRPSVWIYSKPDRPPVFYDLGSRLVWPTLDPIRGTFTGYFHFVPDEKSRMQSVFDPGPFQFEVIAVSDLHPQIE